MTIRYRKMINLRGFGLSCGVSSMFGPKRVEIEIILWSRMIVITLG